MKLFYLRKDILEALAFQTPFHELAFSWGKDKTIRYLKADNIDELKALLERYGTNEPFAVFRSVESFSNPLELRDKPPSALRIGWDFILDLDSDDFESCRRATVKTIQLLEFFGIKSFAVKFSGRRGFHIIVPGKVFDVGTQREWLDAYPTLPKMLAEFARACLSESRVELDLSIYAPRHLIRCAYSLHVESGLVSIPIGDPTAFKLEDAKPENVKASIDDLREDAEVGSGLELIKACGDWLKDRHVEPGIRILNYGSKRVSESYRWIEALLEQALDDGRHRVIWLLLSPYLVNVKGLSVEDATERMVEFLKRCHAVRPVRENLRSLARYYAKNAERTKLMPLSFRTLKSKYPNLYEIVMKALKGSKFENDGGKKEKPLTYESFEIATNYDDEDLRRLPLIAIKMVERELEYEIEDSTLEEAKAITKRLLKKFQKYPRSEHWNEDEESNILLGLLGEKVFDMTLNQFKIPHVWNHPIIQDAAIRDRKPSEPDFTVGSDKVDVKTTSSKTRPEAYFINKKRFEEHYADIYIFIRFNEKLSRAWISGWLSRSQVSEKKVKRLKYDEALVIPLKDLNPLETLLKRWNADEMSMKLFYPSK